MFKVKFLPDEKKVEVQGETTLMEAAQIARGTTNIELSTYQSFMDEYVAAMFLPHTDRRLFPSVDY